MSALDYILYVPVATVLFVLTIAASILAFNNPGQARNMMLHPYSVIREKRYYTALTSGFIHGDWQHLIFNMMSFYFFAFPLESMMAIQAGIWGHVFFGIIYLVSMVLADISSILRHKNNPDYYSLGASGAITAVLFSFILFDPTTRISILFIPVGVPAPIFAVIYVAYSIIASRSMRGNINHEAHLSGAFSGLILTIIFFPGILKHFISTVFG